MTEQQRAVLAEKPGEFLKGCLYHEPRIQEKLKQINSYKEIVNEINKTAKNVSIFGLENSGKMGRCAAKIVQLQNDIEAEVLELQADVELVKEAIALLDDDCQKLLMEARYLRHMKWEEIAMLIACSYRWTLRLHGIALQKISKEAILIHI